MSVPCPWPGRSAGGHSQVAYDALAHTAFDGDADAICLDSAAGHAALAMRLFVNLLQRDISGFQTSKSPGVGGGARAKPVVDGVGWSEKRESEVCAPIWLVRLVGVNPGNGRLLMEDKDAAWKLGGEVPGSFFVVLSLLKSSRCFPTADSFVCCIFCLQRRPRPTNNTSSRKQQSQARGNTFIYSVM